VGGVAAILLHLLASPQAVITVAGAPIPIGTLGAFPKALTDVLRRAPPLQTINDLMPIVETVSDVFFPGAGVAEAIVWFVVTHGKPMTHADYVRSWARAQGSELGSDRMLIEAGLAPDPYNRRGAGHSAAFGPWLVDRRSRAASGIERADPTR
jgi:hypothetical protein